MRVGDSSRPQPIGIDATDGPYPVMTVPLQFPRDDLMLQEKLGEGEYGPIYRYIVYNGPIYRYIVNKQKKTSQFSVFLLAMFCSIPNKIKNREAIKASCFNYQCFSNVIAPEIAY